MAVQDVRRSSKPVGLKRKLRGEIGEILQTFDFLVKFYSGGE